MSSSIINHTVDGSEVVITLSTNLVSTHARDILQGWKAVLNEVGGVNAVCLDLKKVTTVDSQGLNLLLGMYQECKHREWGLRVRGVSRPVEKILRIFKLTEILSVEAGEGS